MAGKRKAGTEPKSGVKRPRNPRKQFKAAPRQITTDKSVTMNVTATSNPFSPLERIGDEEVILNKNVKQPKLRIPPINIFDQTRDNLINFLQGLKVTDFRLKPLKRGYQVLCGSTETHNAVIAGLKVYQGEVQFYSHDLPTDQHFKVALYNLHAMEISELEADLHANNLNPEKIQVIEPKRSRYTNHRTYILYFKKNSITLSELQKVDTLCQTVVEWQPYQKLRQGPTQCQRCQRPGHGSRHCHMPARCEFCAENHLSTTCPTLAEHRRKAEEDAAANGSSQVNLNMPGKCCNCNEAGHFASDPKCPRKLNYIKKRSHVRRVKPVPDLHDKQLFPALSNPSHREPTGIMFLPQKKTASTMAQVCKTSSSPTPISIPSQFPVDNSKDKNENPFTFAELMSLTNDIFTQLKNVRTSSREEVIMTVMSISLKYLYKDESP